MYYKILNNLNPISPDDHFTKRTDTSIHTRTSGTGLKPFSRTNRIYLFEIQQTYLHAKTQKQIQ